MRKLFTTKLLLVAVLLLFGLGNQAWGALNGTYSINAGAPASSTNYQTVGAAISDLMSGLRADGGPINGPGVSGPVTLRIAAGSGPYNEQVSIGSIPGTNGTRTVRLTGGPTRETIQFTNTTTTDRHVVRLSGTKNIILDSLTLINNGATYGYGVWITANSDSNFVKNSLITVSTTSTAANFAGITISGSTPTTTGDNGDYNTIQGNVVSGGYYGFSCNGTSSTVYSQSNHVIDNEFKEFYYYGIRHYMQNGATIRGNYVHARATGTTAGYGMYIYYNDRFTIERNWVTGYGAYGIYMYYGNFQGGTPTTRASVRNNLIGGTILNTTTPYGIYATTNTTNVDFFHNSISLVAGNGRCIYVLAGSGNDIRNNSFSVINSVSGYAAYVTNTTYISGMNYNNYYAPGSSNFVYIGAAYTPGTVIGGGGFNANSKVGDPNYINPANNLHAFAVQLWDAADPAAGVTNDYDGQVRPNPLSPLPDIGADEYVPDTLDMGMVAILNPTSNICPDSQQIVRVVVTNKGLNTLTNVPVTAEITGLVTTTLSVTHPGPMPIGDTDTLTLGTINTWPGGTLGIKAYSGLVGDQSHANDTLNVSRIINLTPSAPTAPAATLCEGDSTTLVATSTGSNYWYDAQSGGNLVYSGDSLNTGPLSTNMTYFVEARGVAANSLQTTYANNNSCGGGNMFDVTAYNEITIDSFDLNMNAGTVNVDVYYKTGSYAGFETTSGAWTLLGSASATSTGAGVPTRLHVGGLTIPAGQTYSIYVYTTSIVYTTLSATTNYTNGDMNIACGVGLCSLFGGTNNPRGWNGRIYYTAEGCPSSRTPVAVTVNPLPVVALADSNNCGPLSLDAGPGASYMWSTGDTTQTILVSNSAICTVTVTSNGCSASDSAAIQIFSIPSVNLGADQLLCDGASATLDAGSNPGGTFLWSNGDTTQTTTVTAAGTYSVNLTSADGCSANDSVVITTLMTPNGSITVDT
ncbi:MAG: right-handed parallel beta-helix repeat-containing protein, partial [Bacteroidia bacterium]